MYFIAIVLPEEINQKILPLKEWMFEKYQCRVGLKSPAHITLVPPNWMHEETENQLKEDLDLLAQNFDPFPLATENFSCFKPSTIFIAVKESGQLKKLRSATEIHFQQKSQYKMKFDQRPFHPHITIATRDLYKKSFYEAWEHFSKQEFHVNWNAEGISLLKHNKKNWDVVHTSRFRQLQ